MERPPLKTVKTPPTVVQAEPIFASFQQSNTEEETQNEAVHSSPRWSDTMDEGIRRKLINQLQLVQSPTLMAQKNQMTFSGFSLPPAATSSATNSVYSSLGQPSNNNWNKEEIIAICEFSELEGPIVISCYGQLYHPLLNGITIEQFILEFMSMDFQQHSENEKDEKFKREKEKDFLMKEYRQCCDIFIRHFCLYDLQARGYVRRLMILLISFEKEKLEQSILCKEFDLLLSQIYAENIKLFIRELWQEFQFNIKQILSKESEKGNETELKDPKEKSLLSSNLTDARKLWKQIFTNSQVRYDLGVFFSFFSDIKNQKILTEKEVEKLNLLFNYATNHMNSDPFEFFQLNQQNKNILIKSQSREQIDTPLRPLQKLFSTEEVFYHFEKQIETLRLRLLKRMEIEKYNSILTDCFSTDLPGLDVGFMRILGGIQKQEICWNLETVCSMHPQYLKNQQLQNLLLMPLQLSFSSHKNSISQEPIQSPAEFIFRKSTLKIGTRLHSRLIQKFSFSKHILYSLMIRRPLVIIGSNEKEGSIRNMISTLCLFVEGTVVGRVWPWCRKQMDRREVEESLLIGLHRQFAHHLDPRICSILDFDHQTFTGPQYEGKLITSLLERLQQLDSLQMPESTQLAYIVQWMSHIQYEAYCYRVITEGSIPGSVSMTPLPLGDEEGIELGTSRTRYYTISNSSPMASWQSLLTGTGKRKEGTKKNIREKVNTCYEKEWSRCDLEILKRALYFKED